VKVEGAVSTDTTITWTPVANAAGYRVWWRRTDSNQWEYSRRTPGNLGVPFASPANASGPIAPATIVARQMVLPHIRVDDWVLGVSSISKDGFESVVASAVPGGAFKPYVAPEKKP
jgi:hypothetical protein